MIDFSRDCAEPAEKEKERCRLGSLSASLIRALGHFARQIAIPKTVKDFHQTCGHFCGKLGSMEVGWGDSEHSEPTPKIWAIPTRD